MRRCPQVAVLVTAAGRGERFGNAGKVVSDLAGRTVLDGAVAAFSRLPGLAALIITAPAGSETRLREALAPDTLSMLRSRLGERFDVISGGPSRRDSVRLGLEALERILAGPSARDGSSSDSPGAFEDTIVLVHDGARPWVSQALAERVASAAAREGACIPVTPLIETPKEISTEGLVVDHPARAALATAQTPQGFRLAPLLAAHRRADAERVDCTDDAELWARYVGPVAWTKGERTNRKITFREDLGLVPRTLPFRVGEGWDIHRLVSGRKLLIGGVEIPSERGEDGYSDGDVLLHAVMDALLGAAALGDIGVHFPPGEKAWKDANSRDLARRTLDLVRKAGWKPGNLDCTVILETPKLSPHRDAVRASLAGILGMEMEAVSFKAKTKEGVDATGEGRAIEARAVILVVPV